MLLFKYFNLLQKKIFSSRITSFEIYHFKIIFQDKSPMSIYDDLFFQLFRQLLL